MDLKAYELQRFGEDDFVYSPTVVSHSALDCFRFYTSKPRDYSESPGDYEVVAGFCNSKGRYNFHSCAPDDLNNPDSEFRVVQGFNSSLIFYGYHHVDP